MLRRGGALVCQRPEILLRLGAVLSGGGIFVFEKYIVVFRGQLLLKPVAQLVKHRQKRLEQKRSRRFSAADRDMDRLYNLISNVPQQTDSHQNTDRRKDKFFFSLPVLPLLLWAQTINAIYGKKQTNASLNSQTYPVHSDFSLCFQGFLQVFGLFRYLITAIFGCQFVIGKLSALTQQESRGRRSAYAFSGSSVFGLRASRSRQYFSRYSRNSRSNSGFSPWWS